MLRQKTLKRNRFFIPVLSFEAPGRLPLFPRRKGLREDQRPEANHQRLLLREAIWLFALPLPVTTTSLLTSPLR